MRAIRSSDPAVIRSASEGVCYLYVLPCAYEDLLKLGFSRGPLGRIQALQARFFEFFDLDQAFLVETETVRDARKLELDLHHRLIDHNAPAPLTVNVRAGGHSEWYRGAYRALTEEASRLQATGHSVHRPLRAWLRRELAAQGDSLCDRSAALMAQLQGDVSLLDQPELQALRRKLLDSLDAHAALGVELEPRLPEALLDWYRATGSRG
ncbi:GIY-YIG nuclease family protein [Lysobacter sp. CA196]|uniref:GIY-YIG nuclease family protein n=1 Tax=Lysobacter sp. CA196 TaxID=3455606 RepID=UPI003F8D6FC5